METSELEPGPPADIETHISIRRAAATLPRSWPDLLACAALLVLPFVATWRLWTRNPLDRAFIWQDVTDTGYPFLVFLRDSVVEFGTSPKWAWALYSGSPFSASFLNFRAYPLFLPFFANWADPARQAVFHIQLIAHVSIAAVTFYFLARSFRFRPQIAFLGACLYALNGFTFYIFMVGNAWGIVHSWFPFVLLCARRFVLTRRVRWAMWLAGALYLLITSLNPLLVIPTIAFTVTYFAVNLSVERSASLVRMWAGFGLAVGLAFSMHTVELLPIAEMSRVGQGFGLSSYQYARDKWVSHTFVRLMQGFFLGGERADEYVGAIGAIAVLFALWLRRGRYWTLWAATFLICILAFAVSRDFALYDFFYLFVPATKNLPDLERGGGALLTNTAAAFLAMTTFRSVGIVQRVSHSAPILLALSGIIALLWFVAKPQDVSLQPAFQNAFVMFVILVALALLLVSGAGRRRRGVALGLVAGIIVVNSVSVMSRDFEPRMTPLANRDRPPFTPPSDSAAEALSSSPYLRGRSGTPKLPSMTQPRVNRVRNNALLIQGPDNVAGYYPWLPRRVAQAFAASSFTDGYMFQAPHAIDLKSRWASAAVPKLYDLPPATQGRAWIVPAVAVPSAPFDKMISPAFDPYTICYVEDESSVTRTEFGSFYAGLEGFLSRRLSDRRPLPRLDASHRMNPGVTLIRQTPNSVAFRVERATQNEALFLSDNWYPGWTVYVNGKRAPLFVANYAFKAVLLTAPASTIVEFVFDPPLVKAAGILSLAAAVLLIVLMIATWRMTLRPREAKRSRDPAATR